MPLTELQQKTLRLLAAHRSPESYLAGATVIHRHAGTSRFSQDLDFFHDIEECVAKSAEQDAATLRDAGYQFEWQLRTPTFHRALISRGREALKMEWAQDSAFRFFPVQPDPLCGYRLHDADAATNKILALVGRSEIRDYVDALHLHAHFLSLGSLVWAACGKDPGFTPELLFNQMGRHAAYTQEDCDRLLLREPLDLNRLKRVWLGALEAARELVRVLPPKDLGCLYLNSKGNPITPDPTSPGFTSLTRHRGSVRGVWPTVKSGANASPDG